MSNCQCCVHLWPTLTQILMLTAAASAWMLIPFGAAAVYLNIHFRIDSNRQMSE